jgi:hypothetical protein
MDTDLQGIDVHGVDRDGVRGVWVRGETPKELVLSDGTRLRLEPAERGRVEWRRHDEVDGHTVALSTTDAEQLAGDFAGYVTVRTRAEAEWLRAVSDWCTTEADRLESELSRVPA